MKNFLVLMSFVLPLTLMAQTRPMPKKSNSKMTPKNEIVKAQKQKPTSFAYMIMTVEEVKKTKKEDSVTEFKFESFDDSHSKKMEEYFKINKKSIIDILNKLGQLGWELVSVNNEHYFFKNRFIDKNR